MQAQYLHSTARKSIMHSLLTSSKICIEALWPSRLQPQPASHSKHTLYTVSQKQIPTLSIIILLQVVTIVFRCSVRALHRTKIHREHINQKRCISTCPVGFCLTQTASFSSKCYRLYFSTKTKWVFSLPQSSAGG